jgi:hypothetical protein
MSKNPKVIEPANYNLRKAAKECGEHMGIIGCPICDQNFNDYGGMHVVECTECQFHFPVDWWSVYSSGVNDGRRIKAGGTELSGGMKIRMANPFYRTGFNTPDGDAWQTRRTHDWKAATAGWEPSMCNSTRMCGPICERCGQMKDESRRNRSGECVKCEAETECRHRCSMMEKCCKAGVNFKELGDGKLGLGRSMPCYYVAGTIPIHCDKYERKTVEEIQAEDAEMNASMARFMLSGPLIRKVKEEHKGTNWSGVEVCPVCSGKLHMSHAKYNGHVHGHCETEGCLSWME